MMYLLGFSINVLSMLAVVLSVGLVVDDAIVMTENIYNRIEKGMTPLQAGIDGSREILFAIISTSITLLCVFVPIVFMQGQTGRLFREFAFVIAGAVVISTFAALTFTPMLSTKILVRREKKNAFYAWSEPFFEGLNKAGVAVTLVHGTVRRQEVEVFLSLNVPHIDALSLVEHHG